MAIWHSFTDFVASSINRFVSVTEYFYSSSDNQSDGSGETERLEYNEEHDGDQHEINEDFEEEKAKEDTAEKPVVNIHIQSSGTVVVGDNSVVNYHPESFSLTNTGPPATQQGLEAEPPATQQGLEAELTVNVQQQNSKESALTGSGQENCGRKTRIKKRINDGSVKPKISSIIKRVKIIQKELSQYRGNGDWESHDETIKRLLLSYEHDEDNHDISLLLKYEQAAGLFDRNDYDTARKLVSKVASEISKEKVWEKINDTQKEIYCKCLLLVSDIYCREKRFGKAKSALAQTREFLDQHFTGNHVLQAELHLAHARYYLQQVHQSRSQHISDCVQNVIKETNQAENDIAILKTNDPETWREMRRQILVTKLRAILEVSRDGQNLEEFDETLTNSFNEFERMLWDGILPITKVEFLILKCDYFKVVNKLQLALDYAKQGLSISEKYCFTAKTELLQRLLHEIERIPSLGKVSSESGELVNKVLNTITSDSANVESNTVDMSDCGIFSTDDFSDWETFLSHTEFTENVQQYSKQMMRGGYQLEDKRSEEENEEDKRKKENIKEGRKDHEDDDEEDILFSAY